MNVIHKTNLKHLYWRAGFGISLEAYTEYENASLSQVLDRLFQEKKPIPIQVTDQSAPEFAQMMQMSKEERKAFLKESRKKIRLLNVQWLATLVQSEQQLQEKMAFFWHGHFACRAKNVFHAQQYVNTLRQHALGNFSDLLLAVAKEPAMLQFLNNQQNRKRSPNENFARELMELFTIGRGNYTENDVKASARAFTGWGFNGPSYVFRERAHDFGQKTFMGQTGNFNGEDIIRIILENPQTAYFITEKIYRYFVNPRVDKARVKTLSKTFYDSGYHIATLMREIFAADWFYAKGNQGTHIKSPVELIAGLQRQLNLKFLSDEAPLFIQKVLGQLLLFPPNVAGWPGGKSWIDSTSLLFRLKLPESLYKASSIEVSSKTDGDVQNKGLVSKRVKRFQGQFAWNTLENHFEKVTSDEALFVQMNDYFLCKPVPELKDYALQVLKDNPGRNRIPLMSIFHCTLPEYQVC